MKHLALYKVLGLYFLLILGCSSQEDTVPEAPDLPVITNIKAAQQDWEPQLISIVYDTLANVIGVSASNEASFWNFGLDLNSNDSLSLNPLFTTKNYDLIHPDKFRATFGYKTTSVRERSTWRANKINQLLSFELTEIYEDSGKIYCAGSLDFLTKGDQVPFTVRVAGEFKNVRIFNNATESRIYKIQKQLELIKD